MQIIRKACVTDLSQCQRLDSYLAGRFTYLSRNQWQKQISNGNISLNGKSVINYHKKIKNGDYLAFQGTDFEEPDVDSNFSILYEDEHIIAVNKTGNLPVHPAGRFFNNTLLMILQQKKALKLFTVHRLDRETSGVILFAKNHDSASFLQKNIKNAKKNYIAVVHGTPEKTEFTVNMPIGNDPDSLVRKKRAAYPDARDHAVTHFRTIKTFSNYSIINARLETGRQHQIRVHLSYSGLPILGDKLYGLDEKNYLEFIEKGNSDKIINRLGFRRCALHSKSISFIHPVKNETIIIEAPLPTDMSDFIKMLRQP